MLNKDEATKIRELYSYEGLIDVDLMIRALDHIDQTVFEKVVLICQNCDAGETEIERINSRSQGTIAFLGTCKKCKSTVGNIFIHQQMVTGSADKRKHTETTPTVRRDSGDETVK